MNSLVKLILLIVVKIKIKVRKEWKNINLGFILISFIISQKLGQDLWCSPSLKYFGMWVCKPLGNGRKLSVH